jgi:hypothetical protein
VICDRCHDHSGDRQRAHGENRAADPTGGHAWNVPGCSRRWTEAQYRGSDQCPSTPTRSPIYPSRRRIPSNGIRTSVVSFRNRNALRRARPRRLLHLLLLRLLLLLRRPHHPKGATRAASSWARARSDTLRHLETASTLPRHRLPRRRPRPHRPVSRERQSPVPIRFRRHSRRRRPSPGVAGGGSANETGSCSSAWCCPSC